jgi:hypothetical protein
MTFTDVPSPVDFRDIAEARAWVEHTVDSRPWRPQFFEAFAKALNHHFRRPLSVLELGSGPGHYLTKEEQPVTLARANFHDVRLLLDRGGMALYRALA